MERLKRCIGDLLPRFARKSERSFVLIVFLMSTVLAFAAHAQDTMSTQETNDDIIGVENGKFRCPETLYSHADRTKEMKDFLLWVKVHHPVWAINQVTDFRIAVLRHYNCIKTLNNIGISE